MRKVIAVKKERMPDDALLAYVVAETERTAYLVTPDIDKAEKEHPQMIRYIINEQEYKAIDTYLLDDIDILKCNVSYVVKFNPNYKNKFIVK